MQTKRYFFLRLRVRSAFLRINGEPPIGYAYGYITHTVKAFAAMAVQERSLQREYKDALIELQKRFEAVRTLSGDDPVDLLAVSHTREAYERARLLWLSCDLRLRSSGVTEPFRFRQSKGILAYSATENIRQSLIDLLRAHAYVSTGVATVNELYVAARSPRFVAVVAYIEPAMRKAPSFVKYLERASQPLPFIIFPTISMGSIQANAASPASSLAALFSDLDSAIQMMSSPSRSAHIQSPLQLADHAGTD